MSSLVPADPAILSGLEDQIGRQAVAEVVAEFLRDAPAELGRLADAHQRGDHLALRQLAHRFKGQGLTLGLTALTQACQAIEKPAAGTDTAQLLAGVQAAWEASRAWLLAR